MYVKGWKPLGSLAIGVASMSLAACVATIDAGPTVVSATATTDTSTGAGNNVCNPLTGGGGGTARDQGLTGQLYYLSPTGVHYNDVADYIANGTKLDASLFFDQVNVPTRPFDEGFVTTAGQTIQTPDGNTLYEWFAIRFQSVLRLSSNDLPGQYQFALISDDGAVLSTTVNGVQQVIVNDDGTHASKFHTGPVPVTLGVSDAMPIQLDYYQGPRYSIAAIVMWREWPTNGDGSDPAEGLEGDQTFFDDTQNPPAPQAAYLGLLARGWKVVPPENYYLPSTVAENPCPVSTATATDTSTSTATSTATSTDWVIANFDGTTTSGEADLIWTTDGAPGSTTKVYYGLSASALNSTYTGAVGTSAGVHQVAITGLSASTAYFFQAESQDASGRIQQSAVIQKTTKAP